MDKLMIKAGIDVFIGGNVVYFMLIGNTFIALSFFMLLTLSNMIPV